MSGVAVERHDSPLASWETARRPAPAELAPHVLGYAGYKEFAPGGFRRLEPSNDEVHVIFSFGPECRVPERVCSFADNAITFSRMVGGQFHLSDVVLTGGLFIAAESFVNALNQSNQSRLIIIALPGAALLIEQAAPRFDK